MVLESIGISNGGNVTYEFFSGKGGVGKTTLSVARAINLAENGERVLVISTDPAHSLSDSFNEDVKPEETKVRENLWAVEISPEKAVDDFEDKISEQEEMEEMGLLGDGMEGLGDVTSTTPGIDEMAAFNKFIEYMQKEDYDRIIFDTAPTGHTLRFLSLPDVMESWVGKMLKIRKKLSQFTGMFKGVMPFTEEENGKDEQDLEALESLKERIKDARDIMQDPERTEFWLVLIPEEMSLYEGERMLEELEEFGISCGRIIVNKLIPENPECEFCSAKREQQLSVMESIEDKFEDKEIRTLELYREEVRGYDLLQEVGKVLYEQSKDS